jgi:hypothetical protein
MKDELGVAPIFFSFHAVIKQKARSFSAFFMLPKPPIG